MGYFDTPAIFRRAEMLVSQVQTYGVPRKEIIKCYNLHIYAFNRCADIYNLANVISYGKALRFSNEQIIRDTNLNN